MTDKLIVRTSDRMLFKVCRQKWDMSSKLRLNYEPLKSAQALEFGTAWHAAMEVWYEPEGGPDFPPYQSDGREIYAWEVFERTTKEQWALQEEFGFGGSDTDREFAERLELGRNMLEYYFGWAKINDDFEPVTVEHEFETTIGCRCGDNLYFHNSPLYGSEIGRFIRDNQCEPIVYQGRIDGMVKDFRGYHYILEHKTAKKSSGTKWLMMDDQVGSYIWALEERLGIPIHGVIYTRAYKDYPRPPKVLRDGSVSCDKRQSTTAAHFVEAIEQAHPFRPAAETITDDEKYLNYHQFLTGDNAPQFIEWHWLVRNHRQIEDIGRRIALEAQDMLDDPAIYPNVSSINCNSCSFFGPCLTRQEGGDWEYHLASEYRKRDE